MASSGCFIPSLELFRLRTPRQAALARSVFVMGWEDYIFLDAKGRIVLKPETFSLPQVDIKGQKKSNAAGQMRTSKGALKASRSCPFLPPLAGAPSSADEVTTAAELNELKEKAAEAQAAMERSATFAKQVADLKKDKERRRMERLEYQRLHPTQSQLAAQEARKTALRNRLEERVGKGFADKLEKVEKASPELVRELSVLMNERLPAAVDPSGRVDMRRGWFKLFALMDEDNSGRITFLEFSSICYNQLKLNWTVWPEARLLSVWKALDEDESGYMEAGEFGKFLRATHEAPLPEHGWKAMRTARNRATMLSVVGEMDALSGKGLAQALAAVEAASDEEVTALSKLLNEALVIIPDPAARLWYKLFKVMDDDGSGRIAYAELSSLVRNQLRLDRSALPEARLQAAWKAIDDDGSGYISAGEFGVFMRKGARDMTAEPTWKERRTQRNQAAKAAVNAETEALVGKDARFDKVAAAPEEMVLELSRQLNKVLQSPQLFPDVASRSWGKLFHLVDRDGGGRIGYDELLWMIREVLKLGRAQLAEPQLMAVWVALDDDRSGYITAAEFGRFMRKGEPPKGPGWKALRTERNRQVKQAVVHELDALVGRTVTHKLLTVQAATDEEMLEVSKTLNEALSLFADPAARSWFKLFKLMDDDGSGRITYDELNAAVRGTLKLDRSALPDAKLQAVWKALDEDNSGFISAGEFGRLMKRGQGFKEKMGNVSGRLRAVAAMQLGAGAATKAATAEPASVRIAKGEISSSGALAPV